MSRISQGKSRSQPRKKTMTQRSNISSAKKVGDRAELSSLPNELLSRQITLKSAMLQDFDEN